MNKKDEYVEKMKSQLEEWNVKLKDVEKKVEQTTEKYADEIAYMRKKRDEAKKKISEIQGCSEEAWAEMKIGMDKAWDNLKDAFDKARKKFK